MGKAAVSDIGTLICTRTGCGNPRAGTKPWCLEHLAGYQREYWAMKAKREAVRNFNQGVDIARRMLAWEFARHGRRAFTGAEIVYAIENAPRPVYQAGE
jgi:hypothetical protein